MAKRKKTKSKTKRFLFTFGKSKGRKKPRTAGRLNWVGILKTLALIVLFVGIGIGLVFLKGYVKRVTAVSERIGLLELENPPYWLNEVLKDKLYNAAIAYGEDLRLDEEAALSVQQNIETLFVWVDEVEVQTTHDSILIKAQWRKPLALVEQGSQSCYVDAELVVLDFVPMPNLPIVKVNGLSDIKKLPLAGDIWYRDDLAAAVDLLDRLDQMDQLVASDKPLLREIDRIDVSNFDGRENRRSPHIVLYTTDNTEIIWGAELGRWQLYLEATDEEKLARLYGYYKQYGTLLGAVRYINLRDPQYDIPLPIDQQR